MDIYTTGSMAMELFGFHLVKSSMDISIAGSMVMEVFGGMKESYIIEPVQSRLRT
jgi:hypothetical protein